jgi:hypothetical protein
LFVINLYVQMTTCSLLRIYPGCGLELFQRPGSSNAAIPFRWFAF